MIVQLMKGPVALEVSTQYGLVQEWNRRSKPTAVKARPGEELAPALARVAALIEEGYALSRLEYHGENSGTKEPLAQILDALPSLEHVVLDISDARIAGAEVPELGRLAKLRTLTINENRAKGAPSLLTALPVLASVRSLEWTWRNDDERGAPEDLSRLGQLFPALERLTLANVEVASTDPIGALADLQELELSDVHSKRPSTLRFLAALPKLRVLALREVPEYLGGARSRPPHSLEILPELRKLERLDLSGTEISDLSQLVSLSELGELGLTDTAVTDLSPLAKLPKLAVVRLAQAAVTDLSPLAKLPLRFLDLEGVSLGANGLAPLADRAGLQVAFKGRRWPSVEKLVLFLDGKYKLPTLKDTTRPAFLLKTKAGDPGPLGSSFGGTPYLAVGEKWPTCSKCKAAMPLVAQVYLTRRSQPPSTGALQVFYCMICNDWSHNDQTMLLRIVEPKEGPAPQVPPFASKIKPRTIVAFEEKPDQPVDEDARTLFEVMGGTPRTQKGDKLSGWPLWDQHPEWATCPKCDGRMELLLQIETHAKSNLQWGDMGRAHVQVCPKHPAELRFGWAGG